MPPKTEIELVIFDCDGVLIDSEIISATILVKQINGLGLNVDFQYVQQNFLGRSFPRVVSLIREQFGVQLPADFEDNYRSELLRIFETDLVAMPGIEKTMDGLANARVADTISRLCLDGSNRQPKFIFPTIADRLQCGQSIDGLSLEVAFWCRYCAGTDDKGNAIKIEDEHSGRLSDLAMRARHKPSVFLEMTDIFGPIAEDAVFGARFDRALGLIWDQGTRAALDDYLSGNAL